MSGVSCKQRYSCFVFQIMKRNLNNVKRMTSHPVYQYCKCQSETCSSSLHSPHPLSDAHISVASHSFLYACVYACGHTSDMTGAQDGSVRMFEWKRPQQLICFRQAGNARVTRLYFNSQGNKVHARTRAQGLFRLFVQLY